MPTPPHLRIFSPHPGLYAYYDGRVPGYRHAPEPNWVDEGAIELGIATYALVEGAEALVYDTHVSPDHGRAIRAHLEGLGVRHFTLIYSHCHLDHIAGSAAFDGAEIIANQRTIAHLTRDRAEIEAGRLSGPPAIRPLLLPTRGFSGALTLQLGQRQVQLIEANIHSDDATVLWLPDEGILLAGDTVEDCVTYVGAPEDFDRHLHDLERLAALGARHILPDHGDEQRLRAGGYGPALIAETAAYIRWLQSLATDPARAARPLAEVIATGLASGALCWFQPYEAVHRQNVERTLAHLAAQGAASRGLT